MQNIIMMHRDLTKLLELGVNEKWLSEANMTPKQARDLLMGILYLREMHPKHFE